jgi:hypothetical protein
MIIMVLKRDPEFKYFDDEAIQMIDKKHQREITELSTALFADRSPTVSIKAWTPNNAESIVT